MPGDKAFAFNWLAIMMAAKFGQIKGLRLNLGKQMTYGQIQSPRRGNGEGFS